MSTLSSNMFSARLFMHDHTFQIRGDAINLQLLRQSNQSKYERMKQQNVMILNLRKSLLKAEQQILQSASPTPTSTATKSVSPTSSPSSSSTSSRTSQSSASLSSFTRPSLSFTSTLNSDSEIDESTERFLKRHAHLDLNKKDLHRLRIIDIYLKAIEVTQKYYRKVMTEKVKDNLIKMSTMPVVTFSGNDGTAAYGLVKYPDRLLHAANLEDYLDRCLAKQQLIISEATTKMPPSISFNMLPSSPNPHARRRHDANRI